MAKQMSRQAATWQASADTRTCLDECQKCEQVCLETVNYCLEKGGDHADQSHIALLLDCAKICETSASFLGRRSSNHAAICRVCAEICKACQESCEQWPDDVNMRACADACRSCFESCDKMAKMA
ncbi:MAG: four-helix bundle copper-binding protein [Candidatus Limnocylindria bacterium]